MPALGGVTVRAMGILLFAVKERPRRFWSGQFFDAWGISLDFRVCSARCKPELSRKDVEDAGEANRCGVLRDRARGKIADIKVAALFAGGHKDPEGT